MIAHGSQNPHQLHRDIAFIERTEWRAKERKGALCRCLYTYFVFLHCRVCSDIIGIGDKWFICIDCFKPEGTSAAICGKCISGTAEYHDNSHTFQTVTYKPVSQNPKGEIGLFCMKPGCDAKWDCKLVDRYGCSEFTKLP